MADILQGLNKRINGRFEDLSLSDRVQEFLINSARDVVLDLLKSDALADWITSHINSAVAATGLDLTFRDLKNKETTREDVDNAVTAKINALAGTNFTSLRLINRAAVRSEVGRIAGERLGLGDLSDVDGFRDAMGGQLVAAFDGAGGSSLFGASVVGQIEAQVVAGWQELTTNAKNYGNPMNRAGPPRDAAHAAQRAANRKRQARYRERHFMKWVPLGYGNSDGGNGREGLTGEDAGNVKATRDNGGYIRRGGNQE